MKIDDLPPRYDYLKHGVVFYNQMWGYHGVPNLRTSPDEDFTMVRPASGCNHFKWELERIFHYKERIIK